jgi:flagellar biosynthesis/type III secretory pathway protein FliH
MEEQKSRKEEYLEGYEDAKQDCTDKLKEENSVESYVDGYKAGYRDGYKSAMEDLKNTMSQVTPETKQKIVDEGGAQPQWGWLW